MSGEFGRDHYDGFIHNVIFQIGEDCTGESGEEHPKYKSSVAFGNWLQDCVFPLAGNVAYNEAGDSAPSVTHLSNIDAAIEGLRAYRATYLADCDDKPKPPDYSAVCAERGRHEWYIHPKGQYCRQCGLVKPRP